MNISLKDDSILQVNEAKSIYDITKEYISEGLARVALCAKLDNEVVDLSTIVNKDCKLEILTFKDEEGQVAYRHSTAHVLAQAIKSLYPTAKLAIGPSIKNGFYYDIDFVTPISQDDFPKIEAEMKRIIKAGYDIEREEIDRDAAIKLFTSFKEKYKVELINEIPDGEKITIYKQGDFIDLCAGPHIRNTGQIKAFKLMSLTGSYWKGDSKNKMLSRIYGTAFDNKTVLNEYIEKLEEAKKRDHNKIGRELQIFMTDENIGQGLPLLMPKGAKIMQILTRFVEDEEERRGYVLTKTPFMAKNNLYKISGHWNHYKDGMFVLGDEEKDSEIFALRPMTCPFQYTIYNNGLKSYKDLPIRYSETSTLFRNENSGEMHGLIRVRQFTLSDGHIICMPSQLEEEFSNTVDLIHYILKCIGLENDVTYRFSKYDPNNKEKYIDDPEAWEKAEASMKSILDQLGIEYREAIGEAAFYGPKLDVQIKNVYGKEDTIITVQVDMFLAERFDMSYIDENNDKERPYIIHRSSIGCYERTIALLLEKYAGNLPMWISPTQVKILAVTDRVADYVNDIKVKMQRAGLRVEDDLRTETIGYKIRQAKMEKIPFIIVVGDKDKEANVISVRDRKENQSTMTLDNFIDMAIKMDRDRVVDIEGASLK